VRQMPLSASVGDFISQKVKKGPCLVSGRFYLPVVGGISGDSQDARLTTSVEYIGLGWT